MVELVGGAIVATICINIAMFLGTLSIAFEKLTGIRVML